MLTALAANPIPIEIRAPMTTRLNMSRPNSSVPNQNSADGGVRLVFVPSFMP